MGLTIINPYLKAACSSLSLQYKAEIMCFYSCPCLFSHLLLESTAGVPEEMYLLYFFVSVIYSQMPSSTLYASFQKHCLPWYVLPCSILFVDFLADTRKLMSPQWCHKCKMCNLNSMESTLACIINFMENGLLTNSQCAVISVNDTKSYTNCSFCFLIY